MNNSAMNLTVTANNNQPIQEIQNLIARRAQLMNMTTE
jgi:hypothetical protein